MARPVFARRDVALNSLDRVIGYFSPLRGVARARAREQLRAYEAASPRDSWRPRRGGASADADHLADAATLRAKARALVQNVPYIKAGLGAVVSQVVGTGITQRFTGQGAVELNALWDKWVNECDADYRLDYYGLQRQAYRAMRQDGEVLVRLRPRRAEDGLAVPLQLQVLEIDYLDSSRNSLSGGALTGTGGAAPGNIVIEGVEYNGIGRVVAYWLWDQHPGDMTLKRGLRTQSRRVPADLIIHLYDPERPGQGRGFSGLASIITRARDTQLLEDAELARKNLESRLAVLFTGDASQMAAPLQAGGSATSGDPNLAKQTGDLGELPSGSIVELPPGGNINVVTPQPAPGHVDSIKFQIHLIAAAMGATYEQCTGDMREVNFSSARVRQLDQRRDCEQEQWLVLIPRLLRPVARAFVDAAEVAGKVNDPAGTCEYSTPKWDYVNPQQEVRADAEEVAAGLSSLSEKLRRRGYKPADVFKEIQSDFDTLKKSGVLDILMFLQKGKKLDDAADADDGDAKPGAASSP
jgi:lambda family phage portal protein